MSSEQAQVGGGPIAAAPASRRPAPRKAAVSTAARDARTILYLPLWLLLGYLAFVYLVSIGGPVLYLDYDRVGVGLYLAAVSAAMAVGYYAGIRRPLPRPAANRRPPRQLFPQALFVGCLVLAAAGILVYLLSGDRMNLDVAQIGTAYADQYKHYVRNSGTYSSAFILYTLFTPPTLIATFLGLYYFNRIGIVLKGAVIAVVLGTPVVMALTRGQQNPIGDLVTFLGAVALIHTARTGAVLRPQFLLGAAALGLAATAVLGTLLVLRYQAGGIDALNVNQHEINSIRFNMDHPVFKLFGNDVGFALSMLCNYFGNGLVGLGYCLHQPFTWSHMLGFAYPLSVIGQRVFGLPFYYYYTYPYMAGQATGWGESHWYSVFPWFASDFTFPGTVVLFGLFAYAYARAWSESVRFANPYSIMLFCLMSLGAVMIPGNNQLAGPGNLLALIMVTTLYFFNRRAYNRPPVLARRPATRTRVVRAPPGRVPAQAR
jgi:hypothetical protein